MHENSQRFAVGRVLDVMRSDIGIHRLTVDNVADEEVKKPSDLHKCIVKGLAG